MNWTRGGEFTLLSAGIDVFVVELELYETID